MHLVDHETAAEAEGNRKNMDNKNISTTEENKNAEHKPSAGEVVFDRSVYTGIGFGVNEALSLYITDEFEHGKRLPILNQANFDSLSGMLAKNAGFVDNVVEGVVTATAKQKAANLIMTATLLTGGTLLLWPMKALVDSKSWWVKKINHFFDMFSKKDESEIAKRDKEADEAIACEPKQSWGSLIIGRVLAVGSTLGFGQFVTGAEGNKKVMDWTEKHVLDNFKTSVADNPSLSKIANHPTTKRYTRLAGIETVYCVISSVVLEFASKFFASKKKQVVNPELCDETSSKNSTADDVSSDSDKNTPASVVNSPSIIANSRRLQRNENKQASFLETLNQQSPETSYAHSV